MDFSDISTKYLFLDLSSNLNRIFHFAYKLKFQKSIYFVEESKRQLDELQKRVDKYDDKTFQMLDKLLTNISKVNENELSYNDLDDLVTFSSITQHQAKYFQ